MSFCYLIMYILTSSLSFATAVYLIITDAKFLIQEVFHIYKLFHIYIYIFKNVSTVTLAYDFRMCFCPSVCVDLCNVYHSKSFELRSILPIDIVTKELYGYLDVDLYQD